MLRRFALAATGRNSCQPGDFALDQEGGQSCLLLSRMQTQTANSYDLLNQIVSLTIMAPVPRYRLASLVGA